MSQSAEFPIDINKYRQLVKYFIECRRYGTALYWAEKIAVISNSDPHDIYCQCQCLFLLKEYHRAAHLIKHYRLEKNSIPCYNLLLECLYEAKEYNEAANLIHAVDIDILSSTFLNSRNETFFSEDDKNEVVASVYFLKGKVYEALDNRVLAMDYFVQALQKSVYCVEALDSLIHHEMLLAWEEKELISNLPFLNQCSEGDTKLIKILYESKLKHYYECENVETSNLPIGSENAVKELKEKVDKIIKKNEKPQSNVKSKLNNSTNSQLLSPANRILEDLKNSSSYSLHNSISKVSGSNFSILDTSKRIFNTSKQNNANILINIANLNESTDIMAANAEKLFYDFNYKGSLKKIEKLLKKDPFHEAGLTIQIGCLVELEDFNKLFYVAHKLVDRYPDKAISWYAVGCYYDLIGKSDPARRYLSKATTLDRLYGPAWLAYGHSYAKENEHDQAMAAYFKATQLMRGCHLPLLYIGVECGLTKNLELAEKFFSQAMSIAPMDVFVFHELGVIKYEYEFYKSAEEVFRLTAEFVIMRAKNAGEEISSKWEPLFNNLAHCCRKNQKYEEALEFHQVALLLKPQTAETLTSIGFVHSLMGNLDAAIKYFHKSLSINRNCVVTSTILKVCMEDYMDEDILLDDPTVVNMKMDQLTCENEDYSVCDMSLDI